MSKRPTRRQNFRSASTPATVRRQRVIREILEKAQDGYTVSELAKLLGMSRQLCLYHVKKMAATYQLTMVLEPCLGNGGLQFRVWDDAQVAAHYARMIPQLRRAA